MKHAYAPAGFLPDMLARVQVRYPEIPIVFLETRPLARGVEHSRYLEAALAEFESEQQSGSGARAAELPPAPPPSRATPSEGSALATMYRSSTLRSISPPRCDTATRSSDIGDAMRTTSERDELPGPSIPRRVAKADPARGPEQAILELQQTAGNTAVERLLAGSARGPDVQRQGSDATTFSRDPSGGGDTSAVPVDAPSTAGTATLKAPGLVESLPLMSVSFAGQSTTQRGQREDREEREDRRTTQVTITFEMGPASMAFQKALLDGKLIKTATVEMGGMKLELTNVLISSFQVSGEERRPPGDRDGDAGLRVRDPVPNQ